MSLCNLLAGVVHLEHLLGPQILLLELLAVDVDDGGVEHLEPLAGRQKRHAFGIFGSVAKVIAVYLGEKIVVAVSVIVPGKGCEHKLAGGDVSPDGGNLLYRAGEEAGLADVEQAKAVLNSCAVGSVIPYRPVVVALVVGAVVLCQVVEHLLRSLYLGRVKV